MGVVRIAVVVALRSAIAVVHGSGVNAPADGLALAGTPTRLASTRRTLLAKSPSILVSARALALTVSLLLPLSRSLPLYRAASMLWCCTLRSRSTAAAPPSTSLPSGLSAAGRRIASLIHVALLVTFVFPRLAGLPHLQNALLAVSLNLSRQNRRVCDWNRR